MTKQYITVSKASDLDWRIKVSKKYEVVGKIGNFYLIWANGHQSLIQADRVANLETVEIKDEGGGYLNESKRVGKKRTSHRGS